MAKQAAIYRNNKFHHQMKLADARSATGLRARPDGGFDEIHAQKPITGYSDGPFGVGNLLPFYRIQNKLLKPEPLHYCIPACGAHGRFQSVAKNNFVPEAATA